MLKFNSIININVVNFKGNGKMVYITGDTHGEYERFESKKLKKLTENDTLIICGDFGFLWDDSLRERQLLKKLSEKKYKILFVEGTHENYNMLSWYPVVELYGGRARKIRGNIYQLLRGEIYTIEQMKYFTFGGGDSPDKEMRKENGTWWREEMPSMVEMQYAVENLDKNDRCVDYIITHEPSMRDMALICRRCRIDPLSTFLDELSRNISYKRWYFGSLHKNKKLPSAQCVFTDIIRVN